MFSRRSARSCAGPLSRGRVTLRGAAASWLYGRSHDDGHAKSGASNQIESLFAANERRLGQFLVQMVRDRALAAATVRSSPWRALPARTAQRRRGRDEGDRKRLVARRVDRRRRHTQWPQDHCALDIRWSAANAVRSPARRRPSRRRDIAHKLDWNWDTGMEAAGIEPASTTARRERLQA